MSIFGLLSYLEPALLVVAAVLIGEQIKAGTPQYAMYGFAIFYAVCLVLNWWFYLRSNAYVKNP